LPYARSHKCSDARSKRDSVSKERTNMSDTSMFLYAGEYESVEDAKVDLQEF
jgi:hypothetical protein